MPKTMTAPILLMIAIGIIALIAAAANGALDGIFGGTSTTVLQGFVETDPVWDVKGDIVAASANNAADRLPIGIDGQFLSASSTAPLGVVWAAGASAEPTATPAPTATPIPPVATATPQPTATPPAYRGASVKHSTTQVISSAVTTSIAFDTEFSDSDAYHDTATNNSRLTIPSGLGGIYYIECNIAFDFIASGAYQTRASIRLNGTDIQRSHFNPQAASQAAPISLSFTRSLVATDFVECGAYQDSGTNKTLSGGLQGPYFSIFRLGP